MKVIRLAMKWILVLIIPSGMRVTQCPEYTLVPFKPDSLQASQDAVRCEGFQIPGRKEDHIQENIGDEDKDA